MCYHVSSSLDSDRLKSVLKKKVVLNAGKYVPGHHFHGFSKPYLPVISTLKPEALDFFRWMLIPGWVKTEKDFKSNTLNATCEDLFEKPSYRSYWKNRCLIAVSGFFEPHQVAGQKSSQTYYVRPKEGEILTLGGIFSVWQGMPTFSIITVPASPLLEEVHNEKKRMPLILDGDNAAAWLLPDLSREEMTNLMIPYPEDSKLEAFRVMDGVLNTRMDTNIPEVTVAVKG
ncbi:MAG TPA: SOS response-associated peptidase [Algoriphagus sp.]|nr:SOS response-associated peptidase [Algoriphagus sp.]